jgi:hypothetical protein
MTKHLAINDFDMAAVTEAVRRYKAAGLSADFDISRQQEGVVTIGFQNPVTRDGLVVFEIHKVAHRGWLKEKAHWVVQLYSRTPTSDGLERKGCVAGKMLVYAIHAAEVDLKHGFLSICDFELAAAQD